jgi:hypothetical protein
MPLRRSRASTNLSKDYYPNPYRNVGGFGVRHVLVQQGERIPYARGSLTMDLNARINKASAGRRSSTT